MDGIELMASAMHAAQARLDVSAANLANVSSDGFQKRLARTSLGVAGLVASSSIDRSQGSLRHTGRNFDLATTSGALLVRDSIAPGQGKPRTVEVRSGSFTLNAAGELRDERGRVLLGGDGPLHVKPDATIDSRGIVREGDRIAGRLRLVPGTVVESGFLEASNVDAVTEMVDILAAQRSFETAQKTLSAIDDVRSKNVNDVVRVKS